MVFELQFTGTASAGSRIPFQFNASLANGQPLTATVMVPYDMPNIFNDFEADNGNFQSETGWVWGTPTQVTPYSGTKVWATNLSGNYPDLVNYQLFTPVYALETGSQLRFYHAFGFENNYDGGNVAISTDNGSNWTVLTPTGGYTHQSLAGLNGEPGWSGNSGWQLATFNLNQYNNQQVMFRFRFGSDGMTTNIGWFIDNFELTNVNQKTGHLHGTVIPTSTTPANQAVVKTNNFYATNPKPDGSYKLFLPNGIYGATASLRYHQSSSVNNVSITPANPIRLAEFTLISLPQPEAASFTVDNQTGLVSLVWNEPFDPVLPVMGYNVYKRFDSGPFVLIQETASTSYDEYISLEGSYRYYIAARYLNIEGCPSDTLAFSFPWVDASDQPTPGLVTRLNHNYPNPFNPSTTISFDLAQAGEVKLRIFNVKGQLVKTLANGNFTPGNHKAVWDGKDTNNRNVASGVYFYRLETKGFTQTRKMLMIK